ncbi:MAG: amidohydrolase [Candidatus Lambdaproteobacteria bacterium]|nr:amidohydrolase [Candidatus Lambdaproteobacteria bacterium]
MAGNIIISADSHIFEPVKLWETRMDKKFRDRAPRFVPNYQGKPGTWFVAEGAMLRAVGSIAAVGMDKAELAKFAGAHHQDLRPGGWDPVERLKDQAIDGVSAEVLYPTYAMGLYAMPDAELQEAAFEAYNGWLLEYCNHAPEQLAGLALISIHNVDRAIEAMQRWRKRGLRGSMIAFVPPEGLEFSQPHYDPLWSAVVDLGMPVHLHTLTAMRKPVSRFSRDTYGSAAYAQSPLDMQLTLADLLCSGMLDRHPRLRFVMAEADIGWIPHLLARLDRGHERYARQHNIPARHTPSEYFHRQVSATFIKDRVGVFCREFIGVDNLMWSSDYPHTDSTWPRSHESLDIDFAGVSPSDRLKMTCTNAARLYGFHVNGG